MSRVSVIIPNYNRENLLGQTLTNLFSQLQSPAEVIVVDDGSTDSSLSVIRSFGSAVKLVQQKNQGPGAARNAGLKVAMGDYIQFQDSDDLFSLNKLQVQAQLLDDSGADIAFGPWAHVAIHDRQLTFQTCVLQQLLPSTKLNLTNWLLRGWFTVFQSLLFRRSFLLEAIGYETDVRYGEDMEFFFRLASRSPEVAFSADSLTLYRVNSTNNLSSDGGALQTHRVLDWARCLERIGQHQRILMQNTDSLSLAIFLVGVRKHLRYLRSVPDAPLDLIRELSDQVARVPGWFLGGLEFWLRVSERLRLLCFGHRWMTGLQAGPPTEQQRRLITALGFNISA